MVIGIYIKAVLRLKSTQSYYDDLNNRFKALAHKSDFCTQINHIDPYVEAAMVAVLDDAFLAMTGFPELASYYLYECDTNNRWCINDVSGEVFEWENGEQFEKEIYRMVKTKKKRNK